MTADQAMAIGITVVGFAMGASTLPQAIRVYKRKSSEDVSVATFVTLVLGNVAWLAYGWYRRDWPIVVTNAVSFVCAGTTVLLALKYR